MDAEFGLVATAVISALANEGVAGYPGPPTYEMLVQSHGHLCEAEAHANKAAEAAPDATTALVLRGFGTYLAAFMPRLHILPEFSPEAIRYGWHEVPRDY